MPQSEVWESFFESEKILSILGVDAEKKHVVEFGCGYGTFSIPAAKIISGRVTSFEIDKNMVESTKQRAEKSRLHNVEVIPADFEQSRTLLNANCADYVMLFNILHGEDPQSLLREAYRLLHPGAQGSLIHWNYDPDTPRGPPMDIRPKPRQLRGLVLDTGFSASEKFDLPPYHYGFRFFKPAVNG